MNLLEVLGLLDMQQMGMGGVYKSWEPAIWKLAKSAKGLLQRCN